MAVPTRSSVSAASEKSYVDWPAIIAGAVVAAIVSLIMITFGTGLGLSMVSPEPGEGISMRWLSIAAGIWFVWVAVSSFGAGGYLTGRMRRPVGEITEDEVETRDGAHGILVWATGALLAAIMAATGVGGLMGAAATATGNVAAGAADLVEEQGDYFAGLVLRDATGQAPSPEAREEVATILTRSVLQGEVAPTDREHLIMIVSAETGADPAQVEANVDAALGTLEDARTQAIELADQARIAGIIAAFVLAATLLISAVVAYFAAALGAKHRDQNIPLSRFTFKRDDV